MSSAAQTWKSRWMRWMFNWFPAYRGTGGRITYIAGDWLEIRVRLPLSWRTRNYVGTIFGGSMYGAIDPVYMIMLMQLLGRDYVVWDKEAAIRFRRPGRTTLHAVFRLTPEEVEAIRGEIASAGRAERTYSVDLVDGDGVVHASFQKLLSIKARS